MRRLILIFSAVFVAAGLVSFTTISAKAEPSDQYGSSDGAQETTTAAPETTSESTTASQGSDSALLSTVDPRVSQGTVNGDEFSKSERRAIARDLAQEERLPDYSQVVDNYDRGRFVAPGWKRGGTDGLAHGGDYVSAGDATRDARFKLNVPTDGDYALYAWWPAHKGDAEAARFSVQTASGTRVAKVNQTRDAAMWVKLGTYRMKSGDGYVVRVSPEGGSGEVVADAVALVRGAVSPPPDDLAPADGGPTNGATAERSGGNTYTTSNTMSERRDLVHYGRTHIGTPYYHSPPSPCRAYKKEDCSCFTKLVFKHFGKYLPDDPVRQYQNHGRWVAKSDLKRGDLVFFKEDGYSYPITHVAMYSGNGYVLHASTYYNEVVESKMKYINGYYGAKRVQLP